MEESIAVYEKLLSKSLNFPGAKVDRNKFLNTNLRKYCPTSQLQIAVETSTKQAKVPLKILDKIADQTIKQHTIKVIGLSTLSGIPGGLSMLGTIPFDLAQFHYHLLVMAQKLAYLYGYPPLNDMYEDADEELINNITLFLGVMYGVETATKAIFSVSRSIASKTEKDLARKALTKTVYYMPIKKTMRYIGIKINKDVFAKNVAKSIPILGGVVSGVVSYTSIKPMSKKLKLSLKESFVYCD